MRPVVIPYGRQDISEADIEAVVRVLRSDFLTQGPAVPAFEAAVAQRVGAGHAVAVSSATAALHLACLALGVGPGDRVWTSPISFVASANCARYCGADVDFVDIDPQTWNMSPQRLAEMLEAAAAADRLPKVVIPVHLCGLPCDMAEIHALSQRYGFAIIEDASHAIGAQYRGEPIGNCRYSAITVFSFHPVKIITTGEGGLATTNDAGLAARMARLRSHGITRDPAQMTREPDGPWYYEQLELGYNYRMTDIQAALGHSQLERLDEFLASREAIACRYDGALAGLPLRLPARQVDRCSAWHLYVIRLAREQGTPPLRQVHEQLRDAGISVNLHYIPIYRQPFYRQSPVGADRRPAAEAYYAEALSLPQYATFEPASQEAVIAALERALAR